MYGTVGCKYFYLFTGKKIDRKFLCVHHLKKVGGGRKSLKVLKVEVRVMF